MLLQEIFSVEKVAEQPAAPPAFTGGPKVHFPDVEDQESIEDEGQIGEFKRHDTPHPKHGPKVKGRQIDGHVIQHETSNNVSHLKNVSCFSVQSKLRFFQTEKDAPFRVGESRRRSSEENGINNPPTPRDERTTSPTASSPAKRPAPVPPP